MASPRTALRLPRDRLEMEFGRSRLRVLHALRNGVPPQRLGVAQQVVHRNIGLWPEPTSESAGVAASGCAAGVRVRPGWKVRIGMDTCRQVIGCDPRRPIHTSDAAVLVSQREPIVTLKPSKNTDARHGQTSMVPLNPVSRGQWSLFGSDFVRARSPKISDV